MKIYLLIFIISVLNIDASIASNMTGGGKGARGQEVTGQEQRNISRARQTEMIQKYSTLRSSLESSKETARLAAAETARRNSERRASVQAPKVETSVDQPSAERQELDRINAKMAELRRIEAQTQSTNN
jgi:hypothetical protein